MPWVRYRSPGSPTPAFREDATPGGMVQSPSRSEYATAAKKPMTAGMAIDPHVVKSYEGDMPIGRRSAAELSLDSHIGLHACRTP